MIGPLIGLHAFRAVPAHIAQEVARVGIVPLLEPKGVGETFELAGQKFVVIGTATREEFIETAKRVLGEDGRWSNVPPNMHFTRVSTDW